MSFRIGDEVEMRIYPYQHEPQTWHGKVVELPQDIDEDDDVGHYGIAYTCPISGTEYITYRTSDRVYLAGMDLNELLTI